MKFRFYQLFYALSIALLVFAMFCDVVRLEEPSGASYMLGNFSLQLPDGSSTAVVAALGVILIVAALVNLFGLFVSLFSNFELQKRSAILSMLLLVGYYILLVVYVLIMIDTAIADLRDGVILPLAVVILNAMTFLSVRRTEAKILAKATGFRLRD